jgi:EmrB/QacA subfamily drug resistance transporter
VQTTPPSLRAAGAITSASAGADALTAPRASPAGGPVRAIPQKAAKVRGVTDTTPESARVTRLLPWLVATAFFMESLDTTILNTAVPTIAGAFHVAPLSIKAVLTSYTLSLAIFIPLSGWVADRFGTRRVFSSAIGLFTLGSLLCGLSSNIHMLIACRVLQGCGGAMMMPVGRLTLVRTFPKSELLRAMSFVAIPGLIGPMIGPLVGGLIVSFFPWRVLFFVNLPIGLVGLWMVSRNLPDYRAAAGDSNPLDVVGVVLFGAGIALLSWVLEIFGEHTMSPVVISALLGLSMLLLAGYGRHAVRVAHPLLDLGLFRIRTLRAAVLGSFVTRLGVGGIPFLLPLLYQVGLGYTPIQSGLLIMPQPLASMSLKVFVTVILTRLGYRRVLLSNTVAVGLIIALFATIGANTPAWLIVLQAFAFGFCQSLQFTSMNTLVYADVGPTRTSMASTIASTAQQMSVSFGIATASLVTALFIPDRAHAGSLQIVHGIHYAFIVLGTVTVASAAVFAGLREDDGDDISEHKAASAAPATSA